MICSRYSNKAANLFVKYGIKKGDMVMLVLKRHYQFWFSILALHKIGAVAIPATNLLTKKDYVYRFEAAGVTSDLSLLPQVMLHSMWKAPAQEYHGLTSRFTAMGSRPGWIDFDAELEAMPDEFAAGLHLPKLWNPC